MQNRDGRTGTRIVTRPTARISADAIARAALDLLNEVGLDGLTMRLVAKQLDVQAAALYWHVKNKRQLLDAMAELIFAEAAEGLGEPAPDEDWATSCAAWTRRLRARMLRYRDGARVCAGTNVGNTEVYATIETTLRTLRDAGFTLRDAARSFPALLHYAIGFTIEEQARSGLDYGADNPYTPERLSVGIDRERFPLTAEAWPQLFDEDTDSAFEDGLRIILAGMRVVHLDR